jgi:7-cyano-7-deazaguanine synthase
MNALILFSGGIDSTVVLAHVLAQGKSPLLLSFNYGQTHAVELSSAQAIAKYYGTPHQVIHIDPSLFLQCSSSLIASNSKKDTAHPILPSTFVPGRNLLFLSHAACLAQSREIKDIYIGANADDFANYPDCRKDFCNIVETAIHEGSLHSVSILSPLIYRTKKEIIEYGLQLKAPLYLTWSCYHPLDGKPCLNCQACLLRNSYPM